MAMNREQRRYLQKQGQLDDEGNPVATKRDPRQTANEPSGPPLASISPRSTPSSVESTGRPGREVINYTIVVLVTLIGGDRA